MGLRGKTTGRVQKPSTTTKPETTTKSGDITPDEVETPKETMKEKEVETKEVAVRNTNNAVVESNGLPDMPSLASLENALDPVDFGNLFPRVVGSNGAVVLNGKKSLGEYIDVQVLSTSDRWMVTPDAEQSDKKAKKLCRASYDGKTIPGWDGGDPIDIEDWKKEIEDAGYAVNPVGKYKDIFCSVFNADKNADIAEEAGIVQVSVSPSAVKGLRAFIMQTKLKVARGQMLKSHQNCIRIKAEAVTGDINYTYLNFKVVPLDILEDYEPVLA